MALFSYVYYGPARMHFRWRYSWAVQSRLHPMIEVARTLKHHFENIITHLCHRVTNAASESINAKIQWVRYTAGGSANCGTSSTTSTSSAAGWTSPQLHTKMLKERELFVPLRPRFHAGSDSAHQVSN
jgi:hypothetical protein